MNGRSWASGIECPQIINANSRNQKQAIGRTPAVFHKIAKAGARKQKGVELSYRRCRFAYLFAVRFKTLPPVS
jgi:hypothetical protein